MRSTAIVLILFFSLNLCAGCATTGTGQSGSAEGTMPAGYCALIGAGVGGAAGAATRLKKPMKNALIGAIIGAVGGFILCKIIEERSRQAAIEAAEQDKIVQYRTDDGQRIVATPTNQPTDKDCRVIENEAWDSDGTYLGKISRTVCRGTDGKYEIRS